MYTEHTVSANEVTLQLIKDVFPYASILFNIGAGLYINKRVFYKYNSDANANTPRPKIIKHYNMLAKILVENVFRRNFDTHLQVSHLKPQIMC